MNLHPTIARQITAYRIAELHQQAARQRLVRELRTGDAKSPANGRVRAGWVRLSLQRARLLAA